jgi:hypothetical protein
MGANWVIWVAGEIRKAELKIYPLGPERIPPQISRIYVLTVAVSVQVRLKET